MLRVDSLMLLIVIGAGVSTFGQEAGPNLASAKAHFEKSDRGLNEAWLAAKKRLAPARFDELKIIQRHWIIFRGERAEIAGQSKTSPAYFSAAARLNEDRIKFLNRLTRDENESLTGIWIDGNGGWVQIVEQPGRLLFDFNVVRGHTHDLGVLAGVAAWNEKIGWFSDKGREKNTPGETNIAFVLRDLRLEIISANAKEYLGRHAYFDGAYFKASSLDSEQEGATTRAAEAGKSSAE